MAFIGILVWSCFIFYLGYDTGKQRSKNLKGIDAFNWSDKEE